MRGEVRPGPLLPEPQRKGRNTTNWNKGQAEKLLKGDRLLEKAGKEVEGGGLPKEVRKEKNIGGKSQIKGGRSIRTSGGGSRKGQNMDTDEGPPLGKERIWIENPQTQKWERLMVTRGGGGNLQQSY